MEVLGLCLPYLKGFFQQNHEMFFLQGSYNSDSIVFRNAAYRKIKDYSLTTIPFQKHFYNGSFRYVSTLRKKVISAAPVKCLFL